MPKPIISGQNFNVVQYMALSCIAYSIYGHAMHIHWVYVPLYSIGASRRGTKIDLFKLTFRSWEYHHWIALAKRMRLPPLGYDLCHGKVVGLRFPSWQPNRSGTPADLPPGWCGAREKSHVTHPLSHHAEPAVTHLGHHVTHPQSSRWRGCDPPGSSPVMTLP